MKVKDTIKNVEVSDGGVTLTVVIGDGQIGDSIVTFEGNELGRSTIHSLPIGAGPSLRGKDLFVKSIVTDVNDRTNHTSITYVFTGVVGKETFPEAEAVDQDGDGIIYRAKFSFV